MKKIIKLGLNSESFSEAAKMCYDLANNLPSMCNEFVKRLAEEGYDVAKSTLTGHIFSGDTISSLRIESRGESKLALVINSSAILFFEFGAGVIGNGHPEASKYGMGPGTYPGKGNWSDQYGWWYPTDDPRLAVRTSKDGTMWGHSFGNEPHMPMQKARDSVISHVAGIAKEVFSNW